MEYIVHILILIGIYTILSVSLNLIVGYMGLLSIAHAAFYGVGAYIAALLAINFHCPFLISMIVAVTACALLGAIVGIPSLRIRDDYFIIATFAFQVIVFSVLNNWISITGGPNGLPGIPRPTIFGLEITSNIWFLMLVTIFCGSILWIVRIIVGAPFGRVLKAIREDEIFALAAGKNVPHYKILVFVIGAGFASVAGVLYAYYMSFIDPTSFTVMESIFIISIVIIGGAGSFMGPVIGSVTLIILPELLRFIGLPSPLAANVRQIIYGCMLVAFILWRPRGIFGRYTFKIESHLNV